MERTLVALNGLGSVYEVDTLRPLLDALRGLASAPHERELRVLTDHVRAACLVIADGVAPSNKDRGYVLRRLVRRGLVAARRLGLPADWQGRAVAVVAGMLGEEYPEVGREAAAIVQVLADHSAEVVRYHTVTHLLQAALRAVLGPHVIQRGSNLTHERLRFDFSHGDKLGPEQLARVEARVEGWLARDLVVERATMSEVEARAIRAIGAFGESYGEIVSVYAIADRATGEVVSREFCGGPHVGSTAELRGRRFQIVREQAIASGIAGSRRCWPEPAALAISRTCRAARGCGDDHRAQLPHPPASLEFCAPEHATARRRCRGACARWRPARRGGKCGESRRRDGRDSGEMAQ